MVDKMFKRTNEIVDDILMNQWNTLESEILGQSLTEYKYHDGEIE